MNLFGHFCRKKRENEGKYQKGGRGPHKVTAGKQMTCKISKTKTCSAAVIQGICLHPLTFLPNPQRHAIIIF